MSETGGIILMNEKNYKDRLKDVYRLVSQRVEKLRMGENGMIK